nr:transposon tf2-8 polyprotein [Quercus suber]
MSPSLVLLSTVDSYPLPAVELSDERLWQLVDSYATDKHCTNILGMLEAGMVPGSTDFRLIDGLLWLGNRLCIPKALQGDIFNIAHDQQFHIGFHRIYHRLQNQFHIRKLAKRLDLYLKHCEQCQAIQTKRNAPYRHLHPLHSPLLPFQTITIDFIVAMPVSEEYNALLSVTCKFLGSFRPARYKPQYVLCIGNLKLH